MEYTIEVAVPLELRLHLVHGMDYRGVVTAAEGTTDLDQLHLQQFPGEEHGDLARDRERLDARLGGFCR